MLKKFFWKLMSSEELYDVQKETNKQTNRNIISSNFPWDISEQCQLSVTENFWPGMTVTVYFFKLHLYIYFKLI